MPSFPNYRLGPIDNPGVPCTATVSVSPPVFTPEMGRVQVWPNPASDNIHFQWPDIGVQAARLLLFNAYGQPVRDLPFKDGGAAYTLSLRDLPPGIYFWALDAASGLRLDTGKFIKQ